MVGGTGVGTERTGTLYTSATPSVTFSPTYATPDNTTVVELWQPGLNATRVNDYINQAIDIVAEEVLKELADQSWCHDGSTQTYPIPALGFKFLHTVQYLGLPPSLGYGLLNRTTTSDWLSLQTISSSLMYAQGFQVPRDGLYRGLAFYMRAVGTPTSNLTVQVRTDLAGLPSSSLVVAQATATVATSLLHTEPKYIFFDFGTPVFLQTGVQYHGVVAVDATDASNYPQVARNTAGSYTDGAVTRFVSPDWGTFSSATNDFIFQVIPWTNDWVELGGHEWDIQTDANGSRLRILRQDGEWLPNSMGTYPAIPEGTPIRILGWRKVGRPTVDTAELEVPRAFVEAKTMALIYRDLAPELLPLATYWDQQAQHELDSHPVKTFLHPNSRLVQEL